MRSTHIGLRSYSTPEHSTAETVSVSSEDVAVSDFPPPGPAQWYLVAASPRLGFLLARDLTYHLPRHGEYETRHSNTTCSLHITAATCSLLADKVDTRQYDSEMMVSLEVPLSLSGHLLVGSIRVGSSLTPRHRHRRPIPIDIFGIT